MPEPQTKPRRPIARPGGVGGRATRARGSGALAAAVLAVSALAAAGAPRAETAGQPIDPPGPTLLLDVGHSVERPGAISARGRGEHHFNADFARRLAAAVRAAGRVRVEVLSYTYAPSLARRRRDILAADADMVLSIHHDSVSKRDLTWWRYRGAWRTMTRRASGYSLFVSSEPRSAVRSLAFAKAIGFSLRGRGFTPSRHHAAYLPGGARPLISAYHGIYRFDGLAVLRKTPVPAALLEVAVIKNPEDERKVLNRQYSRRFAQAVATAVVRFAGR